ncbi:MAG: hypothetical protein AABX70_00260 [Nanoarchaeota archaeon]
MKEILDLEYRVGWDGKGYWETPRSRYERCYKQGYQGYIWMQGKYSEVKNWVKCKVSSLYEGLLRYIQVGKKEKPSEPISYEKSSSLEEKLVEEGDQAYTLLPPAHERLLLSLGRVEENKGTKEKKKENLGTKETQETLKKGQDLYSSSGGLDLEQRGCRYEEKESKPQSVDNPYIPGIIGDGLAGARLLYFEAFCMGKRIKERWWNPQRREVYRREKKQLVGLGYWGLQRSLFTA